MNNFPTTWADQACANYFNMKPSAVKGRINNTTEYYKRILYNILYSVFDFTLPEEWALNYFRFFLFHFGSIGVLYTTEYGWVAQPYGVTKLDMYYQPAVIEVYNQFITERKTGIIGYNSEIVHIMDDYFGLDDLITRYAEKLANIDKSIDINLMNSNVAVMAEVENKKQAEEIKLAYQEATEGKPLTVINKEVMQGKQLNTMIANVGANFISPELQTLKRSIMNEFLTRIGVKNANYDKKERLNSQEVNENNDETSALANIIYKNIKECFDKINAISDLSLSIELHYNYDQINSLAEEVIGNA